MDERAKLIELVSSLSDAEVERVISLALQLLAPQ